MSESPSVRNVNEADFEEHVLAASDVRPVVIDFWADWCGPCRALGPMLERLVHEREGRCALAKINTDDNPNVSRYFGISGIPAIKVIFRKQLVHEFEGLLPEPQLRRFLDEIAPMDVPPPGAEPTVEEEPADPAEHEKKLRTRIEQEGDQSQARVALATLLFSQNRLDEIPALLEPVGANEEVDRLQARLWLRQATPAGGTEAESLLAQGIKLADEGKHEEALASLLSAGEKDFNLANGKVREAMVKVFYCLGTSHPLANEYRGKLSGLLY